MCVTIVFLFFAFIEWCFFISKEYWKNHEDTEKVKWVQNKESDAAGDFEYNLTDISDDDREDSKPSLAGKRESESDDSSSEEEVATKNNFTALEETED